MYNPRRQRGEGVYCNDYNCLQGGGGQGSVNVECRQKLFNFDVMCWIVYATNMSIFRRIVRSINLIYSNKGRGGIAAPGMWRSLKIFDSLLIKNMDLFVNKNLFCYKFFGHIFMKIGFYSCFILLL